MHFINVFNKRRCLAFPKRFEAQRKETRRLDWNSKMKKKSINSRSNHLKCPILFIGPGWLGETAIRITQRLRDTCARRPLSPPPSRKMNESFLFGVFIFCRRCLVFFFLGGQKKKKIPSVNTRCAATRSNRCSTSASRLRNHIPFFSSKRDQPVGPMREASIIA